jgi:hypothetical protein
MVWDRDGSVQNPVVTAGNHFRYPHRLTRTMRMQLPSCQPMPDWAWAVRTPLAAPPIAPRTHTIADTKSADEAFGLDMLHLAAPERTGTRPKPGRGTIEQNRAAAALEAEPRRVWRIHYGNAHANRCAPPGRNPGGGPQGKSH